MTNFLCGKEDWYSPFLLLSIIHNLARRQWLLVIGQWGLSEVSKQAFESELWIVVHPVGNRMNYYLYVFVHITISS